MSLRRRAATRFPLTVCVALWSSAALCAGPAQVTGDMPLAEYARHAEGKEFYGLYLFGSKAGWMVDESRVADYQGKPVFENLIEMHVELKVLDSRKKSDHTSVTRFALEGEGAIVSVVETDVEDGASVEREAAREGNRLRITTRENGAASERVVPLPRTTLQQTRDAEVWLARRPGKGETFRTHEISLDQDKVETEQIMEFIEAVPLVWGGVPVSASRVMLNQDGGRIEALLGPNSKLLRGTVGGALEIRAEDEAIARAQGGAAIDMLTASAIKVAEPLGDGRLITGLTLELSGLGDFHVPSRGRQRVQPLGNGRALVQLSREADAPEPTRLSRKEREYFLRATPSVQKDDEAIRKLAAEIVGDEKNPVRIAARIVDWIAGNIRPTYAADASTATAVLRQKAGDCTEHTLLFTTLARAAGVPARQLGGVVYSDEPSPLFAWHAWAEVHDGQGWITVDPTFKQLRIDPTHLQLGVDDGDDMEGNELSWVNILGAVKIDVRKVDRGRQ